MKKVVLPNEQLTDMEKENEELTKLLTENRLFYNNDLKKIKD
jgi:hypothetical protein